VEHAFISSELFDKDPYLLNSNKTQKSNELIKHAILNQLHAAEAFLRS
jgi:hypothetical protein